MKLMVAISSRIQILGHPKGEDSAVPLLNAALMTNLDSGETVYLGHVQSPPEPEGPPHHSFTPSEENPPAPPSPWYVEPFPPASVPAQTKVEHAESSRGLPFDTNRRITGRDGLHASLAWATLKTRVDIPAPELTDALASSNRDSSARGP